MLRTFPGTTIEVLHLERGASRVLFDGIFAMGGICPETGERLFDRRYARYVNAVLMTCGMYDGSGEFALNVGIPAKSGVGGGIMAAVPGKMGIGVFSPALDGKGNSVAGLQLLRQLSEELELSIF